MKYAILFLYGLCGLVAHTAVMASLNVFTCEPEWAALAQELGGEQLNIYSATTGLQDPHHIQAKPSLLAKARQADLLICTGAELEIGWLPVLLSKTGNNKIQPGQPGHFIATEFVRLHDIPAVLDRSQGDIHAAGNPHIQTNPHNITLVAAALMQRLGQMDTAHAEYYKNRYDDFISRWQTAIKRWKTQAMPLEGKTVVIHHKNWSYMNEWLGLTEVATLEPKPGIPPSGTHLAQVLTQMRTRPASVIIYAAFQSNRAADWLSDKTGIPSLALPFTVGGNEKANDLFALFDNTIELLQGVIR